ncbi:MAG: tetratricopeptide repeat protein [Candidatus Omnitrophica bacterium]|nr:tetratricopeptide repeat protein [Candidatus Omnitrophota bacterium]
MTRKTLTILFADVQGYTSRTGRQTREQNDCFIQEIQAFVKKHAAEKGGTLVKSMGDGFLLTFESPTDGVACGMNMQKELDARNANILDQCNLIRFRIGISTGEVTLDENGDVYGEAVNIAARIEKFSSPNEVYISESTYLAMNKSEIQALDLGPQRFKNVLQEIRVYKVLDEHAPLKPAAHRTSALPLLPIIIGAVVLTVCGGIILFAAKKNTPPPAAAETRTVFHCEQFLHEGNFGQALALAETLLHGSPQDAALHTAAGEALFKLRDYPRAAQHLQQSIGLAPEQPRAYYVQAQLFEEQGELPHAIESLAAYLQRETDPLKRNGALAAMRAIEQRLHASRQLPRPTPPEPELPGRESLAQTDEFTHLSPGMNGQNPLPEEPPAERNPAAGRRDLRGLREQIQQDLREGNTQAALQTVETQLREQSDSPPLLMTAARVYLESGQSERAEEMVRKVMSLEPQNPGPYMMLATILAERGDRAAAADMLREFIARERDPQRQQKAQERLERWEQRRP